MKRMKNISGFISSTLLVLFFLVRPAGLSAQDTLRTYGPRFGLDLARFLYILADPSEVGAEFSVDFEAFRNIYPVLEAGYNTISEDRDPFDYSASGTYARAGLDYNILRNKDRSQHHTITFGFRYGMSVFNHRIENIQISSSYWGIYRPGPYENDLTGHWAELVGGMKTEVVPNLYLGWSVRIKFLLNPDMDPLMVPELIPGYGTGGESRLLGFSYSILYMIPLLKK
jgi:hypothetical protein